MASENDLSLTSFPWLVCPRCAGEEIIFLWGRACSLEFFSNSKRPSSPGPFFSAFFSAWGLIRLLDQFFFFFCGFLNTVRVLGFAHTPWPLIVFFPFQFPSGSSGSTTSCQLFFFFCVPCLERGEEKMHRSIGLLLFSVPVRSSGAFAPVPLFSPPHTGPERAFLFNGSFAAIVRGIGPRLRAVFLSTYSPTAMQVCVPPLS